MKRNENWKVEENVYKCPFCNKKYPKMGISSHVWKKHTEEGLLFKPGKNFKAKGKHPKVWNTGLTKETDERVRIGSEKLHENYKNGKIINAFKGKHHSEEFKNRMSIIAKKNGLGGHTSKFRLEYVTKTGEIINLHSSYEIIVAKSLDENNISWTRPQYVKWIDISGEEHNYYADFYLPDFNVYLDPKNKYLQIKDKVKIDTVQKQNNIKVFVLSKEQLNWNEIKKLIQNN